MNKPQTAADLAAPRILECEGDWKVSPYGDAEPDRDCYWVATREEAQAEVREILEDEYVRLSAAIHGLDQLQALYHRTGKPAERARVQAMITPLLDRSHWLLERL